MSAHFRVGAHRRNASLWEIEDRTLYLQVPSSLLLGCHMKLGALTPQFSCCISEHWHQYLGNVRKGRWSIDNDSLLLHKWKGQHGWWLTTPRFVNLNSHNFIYILFWTVTALISRLFSVLQKKPDKVVRNRHASVLVYLRNYMFNCIL